ncbi:PREDICTED: polygalacturonase-like [Erythranthe guttata]|uniref:polygalacturonase-like n=1 Tax=Erythranthe guttata TaxID=4155 RepID=UPI00064DBF63|nr:PREDICTED: polygalacturonase-like [Erythranthe guttata]|eukprot:XP_012829374.1 PREDICTED: polygalacturonase-like [Erythranthe guttata]
MTLRKLVIIAPSQSPNTDGIHIASSTGITISNSSIGTGDDCISIGPGSKSLLMDQIACGPGHGIRINSIGSLGRKAMEDGVQDVNVTNSIFTMTQNGVRIKSWPSANDGYARNLLFKNLIMQNVSNPMIIDQDYCPHKNCPQKVRTYIYTQRTFVIASFFIQKRENYSLHPSSLHRFHI